MQKTMDAEEFAAAASRSGYSTKKKAREYAKKTGRTSFTEADFEDLYRFADPWEGCNPDPGLRHVCGVGGGRTTAINHQRYNSGIYQDWLP